MGGVTGVGWGTEAAANSTMEVLPVAEVWLEFDVDDVVEEGTALVWLLPDAG